MRRTKLLGVVAALALCLSTPAAKAVTIGSFTVTPVNSGTNFQHAATHTVSYTTNTAIPAGDIIAIFSTDHLSNLSDSVVASDSAGDTGWISKQCPSASSTGYISTVHVAVTTGLPSGGSVSISQGTGSNAFTDGMLTAFGIHGGKASSIEDAATEACSANASAVTSATVTSGSPAGASGDLLLAVFGTIGVSLGTITEDAAWTQIYASGDSSIIFDVGGSVNSGTGGKTRTVTWSGTARANYSAVLGLFAPTVTPGTSKPLMLPSIP